MAFARVTKEVYFLSADVQDYFVTPCLRYLGDVYMTPG